MTKIGADSMITPPPCKEPKRNMRQIPRGKASANESKYTYIVELAVMGEALDLGLRRVGL